MTCVLRNLKTSNIEKFFKFQDQLIRTYEQLYEGYHNR